MGRSDWGFWLFVTCPFWGTAIVAVFILCVRGPSEPPQPVFIAEKDGVKLYRVSDVTGYVYFTTPSVDVEWTESVPNGDGTTTTRRKQTLSNK